MTKPQPSTATSETEAAAMKIIEESLRRTTGDPMMARARFSKAILDDLAEAGWTLTPPPEVRRCYDCDAPLAEADPTDPFRGNVCALCGADLLKFVREAKAASVPVPKPTVTPSARKPRKGP